MRVKAVFFDAGGTLFSPYPSVGEIYARTARKHGLSAGADEIERRFGDAWHARSGLSAFSGATSDKIEREWWFALVREVFEPLGAFQDFEAFFEELYDLFARAECWRLFDDVLPVLHTVRSQGYRMGILSNWDHRLFSIVKELQLSEFFETVTASFAVGVAKPSAGIFHQALASLGVSAAEALHVGDSFVDDYQGATRVGMRGILLDRHGKAYNGVAAIRSLRELAPLLLS
jgi:putative hydrolase of the HAD superfamily